MVIGAVGRQVTGLLRFEPHTVCTPCALSAAGCFLLYGIDQRLCCVGVMGIDDKIVSGAGDGSIKLWSEMLCCVEVCVCV